MSIQHHDPLQVSEGPINVLLGRSWLEAVFDVLPADNVPFISAGGNWNAAGGLWRDWGFIGEDGLAAGGLSPATTPIATASQRGPATVLKGASAQTLTFTVLELTPENIRDALGQGSIISTAGSDEVLMSDDPTRFHSLGVEAFGPRGRPLRIIYPVGTLSIPGDITLRWGQAQSIPVTFTRAGGLEGRPRWKFLKP